MGVSQKKRAEKREIIFTRSAVLCSVTNWFTVMVANHCDCGSGKISKLSDPYTLKSQYDEWWVRKVAAWKRQEKCVPNSCAVQHLCSAPRPPLCTHPFQPRQSSASSPILFLHFPHLDNKEFKLNTISIRLQH